MKAVFASRLDWESICFKNEKVMRKGASYSRATFHRLFAIVGEMGRSKHEVNALFATVGALHRTLHSADRLITSTVLRYLSRGEKQIHQACAPLNGWL
jgi:hypothetical protein